MGYPAKSYELFRQLGKTLTQGGDPSHSHISSLLKQYSIQSFFVYDPEKDPEFAQKLEQDFMFFDRLTGRRMMFMCLIKGDDPHEGARYHSYDFFSQDSWVGKKPASPVADISLATQLLCNELNLDYKYSPYLVFTTSFNNNWAFAAEITSIDVEETMHLLTTVAKQLPIGGSKKELQDSLIRIAKPLYDKLLYREYPSSIANNLMHFLEKTDESISNTWEGKNSTILAFNNLLHMPSGGHIKLPDQKLIQIAGEFAMTIASTIKRSIQQQYDCENRTFSISEKPEDMPSSKHLSSRNNIRPQAKQSRSNPSIGSISIGDAWIYTNGMEQESKNLLKICATLHEFISSSNQVIPDYSFFTVGLGKCFEIELNHSIGQLLRQYDGIEMPDYYYKFKPNDGDHPYLPSEILVPNPRPILLNRAKGKIHWLAPGIGETKLVWQSMKIQNSAFTKGLATALTTNGFETAWQTIHRIRNKTAHPGPVSLSEKHEILKAFNDLSATKALTQLAEMKDHLKKQAVSNQSNSPFTKLQEKVKKWKKKIF